LTVADGAVIAGDLRDWFMSIGGVVVPLGGGGVVDSDGAYRAWFADHGVVAALQRPDFAVFGTATDAACTNDLLRSLRDALRSS
jgi:hypothetical protein